jgi:hypothetical protein
LEWPAKAGKKILMAIGWADIPLRILQISMCFSSFLLADWKIEIAVNVLLVLVVYTCLTLGMLVLLLNPDKSDGDSGFA